MVLPALALYTLFVLYPLASTFALSFNKWIGIGPKTFVGFQNYLKAFQDRVVHKALLNNASWMVGFIVLGVFTGLVFSSFLATEIPGRLAFQAIFFFPQLLAGIVVAVAWGWIFNPLFGIINNTLRFLGLEMFARGWLGDPHLALGAIIIAGSWRYFGFCMVIFIAALQNTDKSLSESALMDGANRVQIFFHIVLPQIRNVITLVVIITIIDSFKAFDLVYVMTRGGPGDSTQLLATYLYREAFRHNHYGYGSTIAVLLTLFVLLISVLFLRFRERDT